jgi:UPF0716 protein FxsA
VFGILVLAFIVLPLLELAVIIRVGSEIGVLNTLALLIAFSVVGVWLVKLAGLAIIRRIQASLAAGRMPSDELVDGGFVLASGVLLVAPGFITDAVGLALLLPPVRALVRPLVTRRVRRRMLPPGRVIDVG